MKMDKELCKHTYICNNEKNFLFCQKCAHIVHFSVDNGSNSDLGKDEDKILSDIDFKNYTYIEDFVVSKTDGESERISIEVKDVENMITYVFEVFVGITLDKVKKLLAKHLNVSFSERELCYRYKNNRKEYYDDYSIFLLFSKKRNRKYYKYIISFHEPDDDHKYLVLAVKKENKIKDLKQIISLEKSMKADSFFLCNLTKKLNDSEQVFQSEQELFVYNIKKQEKITGIPIYIQNLYGDIYEMNVTRETKVLDLKKKFSGGDYFELVHKETDKMLLNEQNLSGLVKENDLLYIVSTATLSKVEYPIRFFTRNLDDIVKSVYVYPDNQISIAKRTIELIDGIHVENQRLTYKGKVLDDDKTFKEYNIVPESVVYLIVIR